MMKLINFVILQQHALFETRDVIIVASVSCIYGLGDPIDYEHMTSFFKARYAKVERRSYVKEINKYAIFKK